MEEIRKIPSPLNIPQPVGGSRPNRPDEKAGDEFKEILDRKRDRKEQAESEPEPGVGKRSKDDDGTEEKPPSSVEERGILLDERA
jgi:hypothetical protein